MGQQFCPTDGTLVIVFWGLQKGDGSVRQNGKKRGGREGGNVDLTTHQLMRKEGA